jgi:hypothetical protein
MRAFAVLILTLFSSAALADDLYYAVQSTDDASAVFFDRPRSFNLARCYGRYDAAKGSDPSARAAIGEALISTAKRDRDVVVKINQFVPETYDEDGNAISTGAPSDLYEAYLRGRGDISDTTTKSDMAACDSLVAENAAKKNLGPAREKIYKGSPIVFSLAACYGQYQYVLMEMTPRDSKSYDPKNYPDGFANDGKILSAAFASVAEHDRSEIINTRSVDTLPTDLRDEAKWAYDNTDTGRPDFSDSIGEAYPAYMRPRCDEALDAAGKP